jgi:bifunctional non-homologous end joining protein LigD
MILPAPMLFHEGRRPPPFGKPGWIYELKFDGYRLVAGIQDGQVQLATRQGTDASAWFPELAQGLAQLAGGPHILDGEACVLDDIGRSDFNRLQARWRHRRWYEGCDAVTFCAFDLLARDGHSLIGLPIEQRKRQLQELLTPSPAGILFVGHFEAQDGRALFERAVHELRLEGLVGKRLGSPYRPGERTHDWVKVKRQGWQEGRVWRA